MRTIRTWLVGVALVALAAASPAALANDEEGEGFLGGVLTVPPGGAGVEILEVVRDGPAFRAGLRAGDMILEIDGERTAGERVRIEGVIDLIRRKRPGATVRLEVERDGWTRTFELELGRRPAEPDPPRDDDDGIEELRREIESGEFARKFREKEEAAKRRFFDELRQGLGPRASEAIRRAFEALERPDRERRRPAEGLERVRRSLDEVEERLRHALREVEELRRAVEAQMRELGGEAAERKRSLRAPGPAGP